MEPENGPLERETPFGNHHFQVPCYFSGVYPNFLDIWHVYEGILGWLPTLWIIPISLLSKPSIEKYHVNHWILQNNGFDSIYNIFVYISEISKPPVLRSHIIRRNDCFKGFYGLFVGPGVGQDTKSLSYTISQFFLQQINPQEILPKNFPTYPWNILQSPSPNSLWFGIREAFEFFFGCPGVCSSRNCWGSSWLVGSIHIIRVYIIIYYINRLYGLIIV